MVCDVLCRSKKRAKECLFLVKMINFGDDAKRRKEKKVSVREGHWPIRGLKWYVA